MICKNPETAFYIFYDNYQSFTKQTAQRFSCIAYRDRRIEKFTKNAISVKTCVYNQCVSYEYLVIDYYRQRQTKTLNRTCDLCIKFETSDI